MIKLVIDNSEKFYDPDLEEYVDEQPELYPYILNDNEDDTLVYMFKTWIDAAKYQIGMGIRAKTTIEEWNENV